MTDIVIQPLTAANQADLNRCDNSFTSEVEGWNRFATLWDIAADPPFRRRGVGRRLIAKHPSGSSGRSPCSGTCCSSDSADTLKSCLTCGIFKV